MKIKSQAVRKTTAFLAGAALLLTMAFTGPNAGLKADAAGSNLLTNGDAETGESTGWSTDKSGALTAVSSETDTTDVSVAHRGLTGGGSYYFSSWSYTNISRTVTLEPNTTYALDVDYYATQYGVNLTASDGTDNLGASSVITGVSAWNHCQMFFRTGSVGTVTLKLYTGWGFFYFDNARIQKISSSTGLVNGDAECGSNYGWTCTSGKVVSTVCSDTDTAESSVAHQALADGGSYYFTSWGYNTISQNVTLEPNTTYAIGMKYYAIQYGVTLKVNDGTTDIFSNGNVVSSVKTWNAVSGVFTTGATATVKIQLYTGYDTFDYDNIIIRKVTVENGLINGDAEAGTAYGWSSTKGSGALIGVDETISTDAAATAHAGLTDPTGGQFYFNSWSYNTISQNITLEPNTRYAISMRYYATNYNVSLKVNDGVSNIYSNTAVVGSTGSWQTVIGGFTTGNSTAMTVSLNTGWGVLNFDDIRIVKVKEENSLVNGDFAAGIDAKIYAWNSTGAGMALNNATDYADIWWGKTISQNLTLEPNTLYTLTFEGYSTVGSTATVTDSANSNLANRIVTGVWKNYAVCFETGDDGNVTLSFKNSGGEYGVSNVGLKKAFTSESAGMLDTLQEYNGNPADLRESLRYQSDILIPANEVVAIGGVSYQVKETGILFATETSLDGKALTYDLLKTDSRIQGGAAANYVISNIDTDRGIASRKITGSAFNIDQAHKDRAVVARAYMLCENADGGTQFVYSNAVKTSLNDAYAAAGAAAFSDAVNNWMAG